MKSLELDKSSKARKGSIGDADPQIATDRLTTIEKEENDEAIAEDRDSSIGCLSDDEEEEEEIKDPKDQ